MPTCFWRPHWKSIVRARGCKENHKKSIPIDWAKKRKRFAYVKKVEDRGQEEDGVELVKAVLWRGG